MDESVLINTMIVINGLERQEIASIVLALQIGCSLEELKSIVGYEKIKTLIPNDYFPHETREAIIKVGLSKL